MADDDGMPSGNRKYVLGVVVLVVIAAAAVFLVQGDFALLTGPQQDDPQDSETGENQTDPFDQYASADEESGSTDTQGATIGETITIDEFGVTPARAVIEVGEAVRWRNQRDFPVRLEFDRTSQTPTLQPGGTVEMRFRAVTYYDVYNTDTGDKITGGSIATN